MSFGTYNNGLIRENIEWIWKRKDLYKNIFNEGGITIGVVPAEEKEVGIPGSEEAGIPRRPYLTGAPGVS